MTRSQDVALANSLANWLTKHGCVVSLGIKEHGCEVFYTLRDDIKPQPAVRISDGRIVFPRGSQVDVLNAFFGGFHG